MGIIQVDCEFKEVLQRITSGADLARDEAHHVFTKIMAGSVPESILGALLGALCTKGECVDELVGAAEAMRAVAVPVRCARDCIDTCGTGGDGISTFNVSTTAAIIAASAGATVAKHGNRSNSRASGSTEVLDHLGVNVAAGVEVIERCLDEINVGYLNAQLLHPAMRHAAPVRQAVAIRTIFNLVGPLTNPAGARRQVVGVPRVDLLDTMATALLALGTTHSWVVHGADGLCDLTVTASTSVVEVRGRNLKRFTVTPEEAGLARGKLRDLLVDSPAASAAMVEGVIEGGRGAPRDHSLLNAGAALVVAGVAGDINEGVELAARAVDDGTCAETLRRWRVLSHDDVGVPPA
ncbi:MAG: anthranilate phosphoribosyltransferase [Phycisphaerae bacterium]